MRPLVEQYGGERVWVVGMEALGYPPAWVHTLVESKTVLKALENEEMSHG
jgi:hypothetical protein